MSRNKVPSERQIKWNSSAYCSFCQSGSPLFHKFCFFSEEYATYLLLNFQLNNP